MYKVFTDGSSSRKNKTIGTSYAIFLDNNKNYLKAFSKGFIDKQARNGIVELLGVYYFLSDLYTEKLLLNKRSEIIIYSDSQYVVKELTFWFLNQLSKNFFETKNVEVIIYILFMLYKLREEGYKIKFQWIKGHQKKEDTFEAFGNNFVDFLAVQSHNNNNVNKENLRDIEEFVKDLNFIINEEKILNFIKEVYL